MPQLINNKKATKVIQVTQEVSIKAYWCGEVLRFDVQPKGDCR